ncbi:MAG: UbiH/UbiF/VisC/COQ6 family ubiquinone biosynthesis hydroxylase [Acetobacteraceae bacterium]|nr:UbiH/UbiF/VisC/COQ6 family ubiquinone biosynthesis hydroxylase [Acetobacteraceae bacterium]MCX7685733.1 UbiH/UbiF/VisC/COQ6 family ubiquinone biosynthesis hydroxylase [Acetobacteraceae bacterium]MDW8398054.1 UbiH/UbiF/VisC/COQ6 family ubiquinone biosynthesis hydroxylase [Acetobacteraceae bacterium]
MSHSLDVAVCILGAGPVGATLAARLAAAGVPTAILDAAPLPPMELPEFDGRAYAIAAGSRALLEQAGVWERLPAEPNPIRAIRVADGRPGEPASRLKLDFSAEETGVEAFGWMLEARALRVALNARLPLLPNLAVFAPARATAERDAEGVRVRLEDGTAITARLLVGAEGRASPSRRAAGIPELQHDYGQTGIVGAVAHERPHHDRALELFLPNGPFAQLPMRGTPEHPHLSAFVWSERREIAEAALRLPDAAFGREIARRMGGHLGRIAPVGRRWSYPLSALHVARYVDVRLALVGDAAHGIHPIAGQGLNLGFRDAAALAEAVIGAADPGAPEVLRRYQRARRPDGLLMLGATHGLEALFGNDIAPLRLARRLGIAAVDRMPALKRFFARRAMGVAAA